jgi:hypothetical protein
MLPAAAAEGRISTLIHCLESLTTTNVIFRQAATVLFHEAGQWARHFSTVRMTIATFTITSCTAIMTPASKASKVVDPIVVLWILGLTLFLIFTIETYHQIYLQRKGLPVFLGKPLKGGARALRFHWASFVIALLCLAAAVFLEHHPDIHFGFARPSLWLMTCLGALFVLVYRKLARPF